MPEGYKAGEIYVDLEVKNTAAMKELDRLQKKLQTLGSKIRDLKSQENELQKVLKEQKELFGENSKQVEETVNKLDKLKKKEEDLVFQFNAVDSAIEKQSKAVVEHNSILDSLTDGNKKAEDSFMNLSGAITAVKAVLLGAATKKLYEAFIVPNAEFETNLTSFEVLLGDYEKAENLMQSLIKLASETPLTSSDVTDAAKQLLAVGVSAENLNDILRELGDLSMGSAEKLDRLINAYGKINAAGKATAQNLRLFTQNGVPIVEELAKNLGVTTAEIYAMSKASKLTAADVNAALKSMTSEGGRFYKMLEKQSQTYSGSLIKIQDNLKIMGREIGAEAFEELSGYLNDIMSEITRLRDSGEFDEIVKGWGSSIAVAVKTIGNLVQTLYNFRDVIGDVVAAIAGAKVVISTTASIAKLTTALQALGATSVAVVAPLAVVGATIAVLAADFLKAKVSAKVATQEFQTAIDSSSSFIKSYEDSVYVLEKNIEKTDNMVSSLESLISIEDKSKEEKNQINNIIKNLNASYDGLNLRYDDESGKLNRNIEDIKNYKEAMDSISKIDINLKMAENIDAQIAELKIAGNNIVLDMERLQDKFDKNFTLSNEEYALYDELEKQLKEVMDKLAWYEKKYNEIISQHKEMQKLREDEKKLAEELSEAMKTEIERNEEAFATVNKIIEEGKEALNSLEDSVSDAADRLNGLADILAKEGSAIKLNKSETQKLLKEYPELSKNIREVADGYEIERSQIENLVQAEISEQQSAIDLQIFKTETAITETLKRISAYGDEITQIKNLEEAQNLLNKAMENRWHPENDEDFVLTPTLDTQGYIIDKDIEQAQELINSLKDLEDQSKALKNNLSIAASTVGIGTKASTKTKESQESEDAKEIRNLKYKLNMEEIEEEEYYNRLEALRDKYYAKGTKEWQQYTLEIFKGRRKIEESVKKAEESAYDTRLNASYSWLQDEQFYGRIDESELIAGYERMKAYTKEYYEQGKIDYEKYANSIKKLDKEIYTARKKNLETSNKELSDLAKQRYEEAVQQIEDYYDSLDRADEEYERERKMSDLKAQEKLYEGAVTKTGKQKLKDIRDDISKLEQEGKKADRELEKEEKLKKVEDIYKSLESTQDEYFASIIDYSETATQKIQELTRIINEAFNNIDGIASSEKSSGETSSVYNTMYQTNNISDGATGQSVVDLMKVMFRYSLF